MLIATPLGVAMAIGLQRWRGRAVQRRQRADAGAARDARDRDGRCPVPRLHAGLHGRAAGIHHASCSGTSRSRISFVVIIVRGRLVAIGRSTRRRPATWAPTALQAMRLVLLPLLGPAIFASVMVVFADVDRRLRHLVVPVDRRSQRDGADQDLLRRSGHGDAGAQRPRHHHVGVHPRSGWPGRTGDAANACPARRRRRRPVRQPRRRRLTGHTSIATVSSRSVGQDPDRVGRQVGVDGLAFCAAQG